MRILTWNLFHGRSVPDRPRSQLAEFGSAIASWEWDVALLQEVPPWWPPELARAAGAADHRRALTARTCLLPVRRWIAERRPDLIKSNGGGSNAILVRGERVQRHAVRRLRWWPERRVVHGVLLESGIWVANLHAHVRPHTLTRADVAAAVEAVLGWAGPAAPVVLGGDFNVRDPVTPGLQLVPGTRGVDHVAVRGFSGGTARTLDAGDLSDHAPVLADVGTVAAPPGT